MNMDLFFELSTKIDSYKELLANPIIRQNPVLFKEVMDRLIEYVTVLKNIY